MLKDYHSILNIDVGATSEEIRARYLEYKNKYEKGCASESDKNAYKEIIEAYLILGNPRIRELYDVAYENFHAEVPTDTTNAQELYSYIDKAERTASDHVKKLKPPSYRNTRLKIIKYGVAAFGIVILLLIANGILKNCFNYDVFYMKGKVSSLYGTKLKGDVLKAEIITSSTVPLTEMFYDNYGAKLALDYSNINAEIDFDNRGNVKLFKGYGVEGETLFCEEEFDNKDYVKGHKMIPSAVGDKGMRDWQATFTYDNDSNIIEASYRAGGIEMLDIKATYNEYGYPIRVIKTYPNTKSYFTEKPLGGTTSYSYSNYDSRGNWTSAKVTVREFRKTNNFSYFVKRQFTYNGTKELPALVDQLHKFIKFHNPEDRRLAGDLQNYEVDNTFTIGVPLVLHQVPDKDMDSWVKDSGNEPLGDALLYSFLVKATLPMAGMTITKVPTDEVADESYIRELYRNWVYDKLKAQRMMETSGIRFLSWGNYGMDKMDNKLVLRTSYYRYGLATPPVYNVNYTLPTGKRYVIVITMSYSSNAARLYRPMFRRMMNSVKWNNTK